MLLLILNLHLFTFYNQVRFPFGMLYMCLILKVNLTPLGNLVYNPMYFSITLHLMSEGIRKRGKKWNGCLITVC